jgi:hypothetical protein
MRARVPWWTSFFGDMRGSYGKATGEYDSSYGYAIGMYEGGRKKVPWKVVEER